MTKKNIEPKLEKAVAVAEPKGLEPTGNDPLAEIRNNLVEAAEEMSIEAVRRLRDVKYIKKLDVDGLLSHCEKIMAVLNKPGANIFLPKGFTVNMQQVNQYSNAIANSPTRRKELREEARRQLKRIPT